MRDSFFPDGSVNTFGVFTDAILHEYRAWAFPAQVADETHEPHFSLYESEKWVTVDGLKLFLEARKRATVAARAFGAGLDYAAAFQWDKVTYTDVVGFRDYILPPNIAESPFFDANNCANWISPSAFVEYIEAHKQPNFTFRFQFECNTSRDAIAALAHGYASYATAAAPAAVSFSNLPRQPPVFVGLKKSTNNAWGQTTTQTSMVIMLVDDDEPPLPATAGESCEEHFTDGVKRKRM